MKAHILSRNALALFLALLFVLPLGVLVCSSEALAVKPPAVERKKYREMDAKAEARRKERNAHCTYGWSKSTGKCYEPKEGQFYRDPKTGEVKVKKVTKWNTPW